MVDAGASAMASSNPNKAFVTLLTSPSYLPGVLVLLHALHALHPGPRDFKIVCLVTPETVDAKTVGEVRKAGYDLVIGVEGISSGAGGQQGLDLMGRPDLNLALTKLHIFRLSPLFSTIIYLDADVLPLRPLDHLFESTAPHTLSACSDTGWPDCFNSGVMVIRPREADFEGLRAIMKGEAADGEAGEGERKGAAAGNGSFDGADQGLLNEWFSEEGGGGSWNRLSFTYNVTPSAAYQYAPAYKRYGHKISAVHFIGQNKPWSNIMYRPAGVSAVSNGKEAAFDYSSLLDRWYSIYDTHVRPTFAHPTAAPSATRFIVPEHQAIWNQPQSPSASTAGPGTGGPMDLDALKAAASSGFVLATSGGGAYTSLPLDGRVDLIMPKPEPKPAGKKVSFGSTTTSSASSGGSTPAAPTPAQPQSPSPSASPPQQGPAHSAAWDAQSHSPPKQGLPEMANAQIEYYQNAWDQPVQVQSSYFSSSTHADGHQHTSSDTGSHHQQHSGHGGRPAPEPQYPTLPASVVNDSWYSHFTSGPKPDSGAVGNVFPWEGKGEQRRADRVFPRGSTPPPQSGHSAKPSFSVQLPTPPIAPSPAAAVSTSSPGTITPPSQPQSLSEAMASYRNAWDSDPSIARYILKITGTSSTSSKDVEKGLRSVPQTPRLSPEEMNERRLGHGAGEARSDGSGDGDDEDDGDDEEGGLRLRKRGASAKGASNPNPRYRDRQAQTDRMETSDVGAQHPGGKAGQEEGIVPRLGLGFAGGGLTIPQPSTKLDFAESAGGRERETSSGSESTIISLPGRQSGATNLAPGVAPASAIKPRRIPFSVSQPSTDRIPQRTTKPAPISFTSSLPPGASPTGKEFSVSGYEGGSTSVGAASNLGPGRRTESGSGPVGNPGSGSSSGSASATRQTPLHARRQSETLESDALTAGGEPKVKASRTFDPSTSVDVRRRDTQEVLTRFMRNAPGASGQAQGGAQGEARKAEGRV